MVICVKSLQKIDYSLSLGIIVFEKIGEVQTHEIGNSNNNSIPL